MIEVEVKARIDSFEEMEKRLKDLGAVKTKDEFQEDIKGKDQKGSGDDHRKRSQSKRHFHRNRFHSGKDRQEKPTVLPIRKL